MPTLVDMILGTLVLLATSYIIPFRPIREVVKGLAFVMCVGLGLTIGILL